MAIPETAVDNWWPRYVTPTDLVSIESVPLTSRGLPDSSYAALSSAARRWPDRTAISVLPDAARWDEPCSRTYSQLLGDVHRYANLLHRLGVRRLDAVALMAPNCAELLVATLAAQLAGIAAPINGSLTRTHVAELLAHSGARVMIAAGPELSPSIWDTVQQLAVSGLLDAVLVLRPTSAWQAAQAAPGLPPIEGLHVDYLDAIATDEDDTQFVGSAPAAGDLAAFFHTGGTTGRPKLAAHTHFNQISDAWMMAVTTRLDEESVVFAALPLFHVNALIVTLLSPLLRGQAVLWSGPLGYREPELLHRFWQIVERYEVSVMSAVPTVYEQLARVGVNADISSLRYAIVGASALPQALRHEFESHSGVPLLEGYGLTEATCGSALNPPDAREPGSVGHRLPYQGLEVIRGGHGPEAWERVPDGGTGVLAISGPTVFPGYVIRREKSGYVLDALGTVVDGWLNTGDLARIDERGYVTIRGRAKDLIIRGGHNIEPSVIEDALLAHPDVASAAAVGRPDVHAGEVPVAYVTLTRVGVDERELCDWAREQVAERAAAPKEVLIVDTLPTTAVGKPDKMRLRAHAAQREFSSALGHLPDVRSVSVSIEDGSVQATIEAAKPVDEAAVADVLGRYSVEWTIVAS